MELANFRSNFLNIQNKIDFFSSARKLVGEFRNIMINESSEYSEDYISIEISKTSVLIKWKLNGIFKAIIMNSKTGNFATENENYSINAIEKFTIYNTNITNKLSTFISNLFIGENWTIL